MFQSPLDCYIQQVQFDGLGDEIEGASTNRLNGRFEAPECGQHDDWHIRIALDNSTTMFGTAH